MGAGEGSLVERSNVFDGNDEDVSGAEDAGKVLECVNTMELIKRYKFITEIICSRSKYFVYFIKL